MRRFCDANVEARALCGASLPLALLLFLICALLTAVVLAAASTVSGRHAQLAENDANYYNATSAANVLKGEIDGQEVVLKCTRTANAASEPDYKLKIVVGEDDDAVPGESDEGESVDKPILAGASPSASDLTLCERTALRFFAKSDESVEPKSVWRNIETFAKNGELSQLPEAKFTLNHSLAGEGLADKLKLDVRQSVAADGSFIATVASGGKAAPASGNPTKYELKLTFGADVDIDEYSSEDATGPQASPSAPSPTTDVQVVTMSWSLAKASKGKAASS